jgi:hypothetical protein
MSDSMCVVSVKRFQPHSETGESTEANNWRREKITGGEEKIK